MYNSQEEYDAAMSANAYADMEAQNAAGQAEYEAQQNALSTTSILALFETNKEQRQSFTLALIDEIEQGNVDPLKVHLQVKCMEDIIKLLNSNTVYKKSVLDAAEKYGEKSFQYQNSKVEIKETGVKYDFSQCGDPVYRNLEEANEVTSSLMKQRADFLKTVPAAGMELKIEDEVITVYPPSKSSTTSIAVTLK